MSAPPKRSNAKRRTACQYVKVTAKVKHRCTHTYRNRSDKSVNQLANVFPPAAANPVEGGSFLIVPRFRWNSSYSREQAAKIAQMLLVPVSGKNLHANGVANGDFGGKYIPDTIIYG